MKIVYPPTNTACGGYNENFLMKKVMFFLTFAQNKDHGYKLEPL